MQHQGKGDWTAEPKGEPLTRRQAEVVRLVAMGRPDKKIAAELGVSEETVAHHLRLMFDHHGVHSRAALVATLAHLLPKG